MLQIPAFFISALIAVESGGNDKAIGDDGRTLGCLQISQAVIDDVNRLTGDVYYTHKAALHREQAIEICQIYLEHYATADRLGHEPTLEDMARIWNGGPHGWMKADTLAYWQKVQAFLPKEISP